MGRTGSGPGGVGARGDNNNTSVKHPGAEQKCVQDEEKGREVESVSCLDASCGVLIILQRSPECEWADGECRARPEGVVWAEVDCQCPRIAPDTLGSHPEHPHGGVVQNLGAGSAAHLGHVQQGPNAKFTEGQRVASERQGLTRDTGRVKRAGDQKEREREGRGRGVEDGGCLRVEIGVRSPPVPFWPCWCLCRMPTSKRRESPQTEQEPG